MDLHERVKGLTRPSHVKMEATPLLSSIMNGQLSMEDYHALLQKFYGYIAPCEASILQSSWPELLRGREKSSHLRADLIALGVKPVERACDDIPALNLYEKILGYLYVIEGSSLGGMIISKMLNKHLGIEPEHGGKYFYGYGKETKSRWDDFCYLLNQVNENAEDLVIASATETFDTLYRWMNKER